MTIPGATRVAAASGNGRWQRRTCFCTLWSARLYPSRQGEVQGPRLRQGYGGHGPLRQSYCGQRSGPASRPNRGGSSVWGSRAIVARLVPAKTQRRCGRGTRGPENYSAESSFVPLVRARLARLHQTRRGDGPNEWDNVLPRKFSLRRRPAALGTKRAIFP